MKKVSVTLRHFKCYSYSGFPEYFTSRFPVRSLWFVRREEEFQTFKVEVWWDSNLQTLFQWMFWRWRYKNITGLNSEPNFDFIEVVMVQNSLHMFGRGFILYPFIHRTLKFLKVWLFWDSNQQPLNNFQQQCHRVQRLWVQVPSESTLNHHLKSPVITWLTETQLIHQRSQNLHALRTKTFMSSISWNKPDCRWIFSLCLFTEV